MDEERAALIRKLLLSPEMPSHMEFGKYAGEPMEVVLSDLAYVNWMLQQDDLVEWQPWLEDCRPLVEGIVWRDQTPLVDYAGPYYDYMEPPRPVKQPLPRKPALKRCGGNVD
jgi:hypothetical protein